MKNKDPYHWTNIVGLNDKLFGPYQPERSKREDFVDLGHELIGVPTTEESWCRICNEESHVIEKTKMRCSEHGSNVVREVQ